MESYKFCYHGTIREAGEAIQQNIDLLKARANTDFGRGFYLTDNLEQAKLWAKSRSRIFQFKGQLKEGFEPVVVYFALDLNELGKLKNILSYTGCTNNSDNSLQFMKIHVVS